MARLPITSREARPRPGAYLFDLDGTLVNSTPLHAQAFVDVLRAEAPELVAAFDYRSVAGMETGAAFAHLGVDRPERAERLAGLKRRRFGELAANGALKEMPGARRLVGDLRRHGATVGVVTSASEGSARLSLAATGLDSEIDFLVSAADAPRAKPFPDLYLRGLELSKARPIDAVAIEDARAGADSARGAGVLVMGVHDRDVAPFVDRYFETLDSLREFFAQRAEGAAR